MDLPEALERMRRRLASLEAPTEAVAAEESSLAAYRFQPGCPDDSYIWLACAEALLAVAAGNFGVGAVLAGQDGEVLASGHNQVFHPRFRSDLHAEMTVLNGWENSPASGRNDLILYSSLEPCPMCLVRLSGSAVGRISYAAPDGPGGMVSRRDDLPSFWADLLRSKTLGEAQCSSELCDAAARIFRLNLDELTRRLSGRPGL